MKYHGGANHIQTHGRFFEGMWRSGVVVLVGIECTAEISWYGEEKLGVEDGGEVGR